ncbi:MAG: DUF2817 domain-containing protein [Deltaproteobacteria bacterium]|nr:DUF2817 domain-containing protein [Deltaproteobacteria bacterium]
MRPTDIVVPSLRVVRATVEPVATTDLRPGKQYLAGTSTTRLRSGGAGIVNWLASEKRATGGTIGAAYVETFGARVDALRQSQAVQVANLGVVGGIPLVALHFGCVDKRNPPKLRVLITAGVHGDEPAGPAAAMLFAQQLLLQPKLRDGVEFTIVPLINPTGLSAGTRVNVDLKDLNRWFSTAANAPLEVRLVRDVLARGYNLALDLHGAAVNNGGFFGLHLDAGAVLERSLALLARRYPIMDDRPACYDKQGPGIYVSRNPGTLKDFVVETGSDSAITVEAPHCLTHEDQVRGTAELVRYLVGVSLTR